MPPPRFLVCYLCGQQFGSASLKIHQAQCYAKKLAQWNNMHPSERGARPVDPAAMEQAVKKKQAASKAVAGRGGEGGYQQRGGALSCKACGAEHEASAKFCQECGERVAGGAAPQQQQQQQRQPASRARGPAARQAAQQQAAMDEAMNQEAMNMFLTPCSICGRKFDPERIKRHEQACRIASKPRKAYNAHKHRVQGTEMAGNQQTYNREVARGVKSKAPKTNWRQQHKEFSDAIKNARMMQQHTARGGSVRDLPPPPPPAANDGYVQCPYCQRRFAPGTAERHIPKCKNTVNRPKPPSTRHVRSSLPSTSSSQPGVRPLMGPGDGRSLGGNPFSNAQTTSVLGSGLYGETGSRHTSLPQRSVNARAAPPQRNGPTFRTGPPPDPKSNIQTVNIFGGDLPSVRPERNSQPAAFGQRTAHNGRMSTHSHPPDPKSNIQTVNIFSGY